MLIDVSYFTQGPRRIHNATLGTTLNAGSRDVNDCISGFIASCQKRFLTDMLGEKAGAEVESYLASENREETAEYQKYENICERLRDSFADYVFYHILRDSSTTASITGLVVLKSANTPVSPIVRQVSVWNEMVKKNRQFRRWLTEEYGHGEMTVSQNMLTMINTLNI